MCVCACVCVCVCACVHVCVCVCVCVCVYLCACVCVLESKIKNLKRVGDCCPPHAGGTDLSLFSCYCSYESSYLVSRESMDFSQQDSPLL